MDISSYLVSAIEAKGLTQRAFAAMIEVSPAYLNKLCKGTKTPSIDMLDRICMALNMTPHEFFSTCPQEPIATSLSAFEYSLIKNIRVLPVHEKEAIAGMVLTLSQHQGASLGIACKRAAEFSPSASAFSPIISEE